MTTAMTIATWTDVVRILRAQPAGSTVRVRKGCLPHPSTFGMGVSLGLPVGQTADYRKVLRGGAGFHVLDFVTHYEAHVDAVHPDVDFVSHLREDAPGKFVGGMAAVGALIGTAIGRSHKSALLGSAIGALAGALVVTPSATSRPPRGKA